MTSPILESFPPLVAPGARILILGNMPGAQSLAEQRYYAHPRNAFWRITGALFGFDAAGPYPDRVAALTAAGVAVWDVLKFCRRPGSLDASVDPDSMVANDFGSFFGTYPTIDALYFNGAAAQKNYRRLVTVDRPVNHTLLPSTSPALAVPFETKLVAWQSITAGSGHR